MSVYAPGTVLSALCDHVIWVSSWATEAGIIFVPIIQMRKRRPREAVTWPRSVRTRAMLVTTLMTAPQGFSLVWSGTTPSIWGNWKKMVGGEMTTEWRTSWAGDAVDYSGVTNSQEGSSKGILLGVLIKEASACKEQVVWVMGIKEPTKQESEGTDQGTARNQMCPINMTIWESLEATSVQWQESSKIHYYGTFLAVQWLRFRVPK